jgi:ribosome-associated protein
LEQTIKEKAATLARILVEKKAQDVLTIDISNMTIIADYFVLATGRTPIQTKALADDLREKLGPPRSTEGFAAGRWIMMDYADVVVHIFCREEREFYSLERLWDRGANVERFED